MKSWEVPHNFVKKVNVFIDEIKSAGDDEVETNDDEALDENDQHERVSRSDENDATLNETFFLLFVDYTLLTCFTHTW